MVDVPPVVRNKALAAGAGDWLAALPDLVADLERDWEVHIGRPFTGGTEAYVAEATLLDGMPAVLKLLVPRAGDAARHEITVLELAGGDGCARLLRSNVARHALLVERLGPSLADLAVPLPRRDELLADAAMRLWRPAPDAGLPTGAAKGRWLVDHVLRLWDELDRPCSEAAVAYAVACAERRIAAHDDERAVLVHGDVHQWNALQAGDGIKLIDPDGLLAEAEYDLGVMVREDPDEVLAGADPGARPRWLAARTGLDARAIWEWGAVERVSTGLICEQVDLQPAGRRMLEVAELAVDLEL